MTSLFLVQIHVNIVPSVSDIDMVQSCLPPLLGKISSFFHEAFPLHYYLYIIETYLFLRLSRAYVTSVSIGENVAGGLIIGLGVVIVIIAVFGCLAAAHESPRRLLFVGATDSNLKYLN